MMKKVLVTGSSNGIGKAIAMKFLENNYAVVGFDISSPTIINNRYTHYNIDISKSQLPDIDDFYIIINNAGVQNSENDIDINLKGTMRVTEFYIDKCIDHLKSILIIGSASAHTGSEFPEYCASKAGLLAYTKNVALRVAPHKVTCNSLDPGGVLTDLNKCVIEDDDLWSQIMDLTPLKMWATPEEIADWAFFLTAINTFATAQNILVDGGEAANCKFIWKE